jgi:hypothetical protein
VAEGESSMGEGEVLFGISGHCFRCSHSHGFIWAIKFNSVMLTLEMPAVNIAFKKMTLDMSGATGNVILWCR